MTTRLRTDFVRPFLVVLALAMPVLAAPASADDLDVLKDRTIRIIASGGPGSTSDKYARTFAAGLEEVLPDASIGVQTITGAGGSMALKTLVEPQGNLLSVAVFGGGALYNQILGTPTIELDLNTIKWVGVFGGDRRILALRKGFGTDFEALRGEKQPLLLGANPRSISVTEGRLINAISGARIRIGTGFDDAQRNTMILSGDGDLLLQQYDDLLLFLESGDVVPVLRYSSGGYPPELDGVPSLADVAVPGTAPEIIELMVAFNEFSQFFGASPSATEADIAALRAAFDRVVAEPTYSKAAETQHLVNHPTPGVDVAARIEKLLAQSDETKQKLKEALDCGEKVSAGEIKTCQ